MRAIETTAWSIALLLAAAYALLLLRYTVSWLRYHYFSAGSTGTVQLSVIIAARNEAGKISACLEALCAQDLPRDRFEVLVIDDDSEDETAAIAQAYADRLRLRVVTLAALPGKPQGKKAAVSEGVRVAAGELIVTTDADCVAGPAWLSTIAAFYESERPKMIIGPVAFQHERSFFGYLQSLEFSGLTLVTGASALARNPLMCNGANLAYERSVFFEVNGFEGDRQLSGDDVFLLLRVLERYPGGVRFLKSRSAIVHTEPERDLRSFFEQRKRWASKFPGYRRPELLLTAALVFFINLFFVLGALSVVLFPALLLPFLVLAGTKAAFDFLFLSLAASFDRNPRLLWFFFPAQLLYSLYVIAVAAGGLAGSYQWKGRSSKL